MYLKNILISLLFYHLCWRSSFAIVVLKTRGDQKIKNHNMAKERV